MTREQFEHSLINPRYADASAQADVVIQDGTIIDTKEHKLCKIKVLQNCLM